MRQRLANVGMAIGALAANGDETRAWRHHARIVRDAGHLAVIRAMMLRDRQRREQFRDPHSVKSLLVIDPDHQHLCYHGSAETRHYLRHTG